MKEKGCYTLRSELTKASNAQVGIVLSYKLRHPVYPMTLPFKFIFLIENKLSLSAYLIACKSSNS